MFKVLGGLKIITKEVAENSKELALARDVASANPGKVILDRANKTLTVCENTQQNLIAFARQLTKQNNLTIEGKDLTNSFGPTINPVALSMRAGINKYGNNYLILHKKFVCLQGILK